MSTPRAEAIRMMYSQDNPEKYPRYDSAKAKIEHNAYLGKLVAPALTRFFADEISQARINIMPNVDMLQRSLRREILRYVRELKSDKEIAPVIAHINAIHKARRKKRDGKRDIPYKSFDDMVNAGVGTYILASDALYSRLLDITGDSTLASHPNNAGILDRLAKMHLSDFISYSQTYLVPPLQRMYQVAHYSTLEEHLMADPQGGFRFKPGFPNAAPIIQRTAPADTISERLPEGTVRRMPTTGCPITFEPHHTRALWELYASQRLRIERSRALGTQAAAILDDTEASVPARS